MTVLHQEVDAMVFGRNRIWIVLRDLLHYPDIGDVELEAALGTLVGTNLAFHDHARFLRETFDGVEDFRRHSILRHDTLDEAAAVAEDGEEKFAALAQVIEPAFDGDRLAF